MKAVTVAYERLQNQGHHERGANPLGPFIPAFLRENPDRELTPRPNCTWEEDPLKPLQYEIDSVLKCEDGLWTTLKRIEIGLVNLCHREKGAVTVPSGFYEALIGGTVMNRRVAYMVVSLRIKKNRNYYKVTNFF